MIHKASMDCADRAESLIAKGGKVNLRYACLELRVAIEMLFYALIPSYEKELPTDILKQWQPRKIIDALIDCDPHVQASGKLEFAGKDGTFHTIEFQGVSKRLIKDRWHKLGYYLHAAMPNAEMDWDNLPEFLTETLEAVRVYGRDRAIVNIGHTVQFECTCGHTIKRKTEALRINPHITCPNVKCGQMWESLDAEFSKFEIVKTTFPCALCQGHTTIEKRQAREGQSVTCEHCATVFDVRKELVLSVRK